MSLLERIQFRCGPLFPLLAFFLGALSFLGLFRFGLVLWQWDRVQAMAGFWPVLGFGLRMDLLFLCMLMSLPVLLVLLFPANGMAAVRKMLAVWLACYGALLVFMEFATPSFINEYDTRPNRIFIEYLDHPREVFSTIWAEHALPLLIALVAVCLVLYCTYRWMSTAFRQEQPWFWRRRMLVLPVISLLMFLGARSSIDHRPANPGTAAFSSDHLVNQLGLSSGYSVAYAAYSMFKEEDSAKMYGKMPKEEVLRRIRRATGFAESAFTNEQIPTLHRQTVAHRRERPLNLVIILEESLGANYVASLGGLPVTPELEALAKEGLWLTHLFATGTRSIRGIEAVVSGFLPSAQPGVVKLGLAQQDFFTLARLLNDHGYHTGFYYGGQSEFDNMRGFFASNGFERVIDERNFAAPVFRGSWGVSDEDAFEGAHQAFVAHGTEPFFGLIFTTSNHSPYEFPEGDWQLHEQPSNTRNNAVKYADHALGGFFRKARQASYWENTVFLVVADHEARVTGAALVPIDEFRIPGLIIGPGVPVAHYDKIASQIDLGPTLLALIGLDTEHPMPGRNLLTVSEEDPGRAIMQYDVNHAYMVGDRVVIHEPHKAASQYTYRNDKLEPAENDDELVRDALALTLWPTMVYRERSYTLPGKPRKQL